MISIFNETATTEINTTITVTRLFQTILNTSVSSIDCLPA
jgi:hypothetical protein